MPTVQQVHQDSILSNMAVAYSQEGLHIADKCLPIVKVKHESDDYYKYYRKDVLTIPQRIQRADGAESAETDFGVTTGNYHCEEYALKGIATDRAKKNADTPLNVERDVMKQKADLILLDREERVETEVHNATTFTSYTSALGANDKWDAYTSSDSDPIDDAKTAIGSILANASKMANTCIMGYEVFEEVVRHPTILDIIKYGGTPANPATVSESTLAQALGIEKLLVGKTSYNTAQEGATVVYGYTWGKTVLFAYINPSPSTFDCTLGYTLRSEKFNVVKWRVPERKGTMIEVSMVEDVVIVCAECGYLFTTVVS